MLLGIFPHEIGEKEPFSHWDWGRWPKNAVGKSLHNIIQIKGEVIYFCVESSALKMVISVKI
jgi:hypothetical protein